jgi:agmatinase
MPGVQFARSHLFMAAREGKGPGVVIFGAPLDVTTSFRPGTRMGPRAIRDYSWALETYSLDMGRDLEKVVFYDAGDLDLAPGEIEGALSAIRHASAAVLAAGGIPLMLGGEHLSTLGAVEAVFERHQSLAVVHLDAHADMRLHYMGQKLSHAGVMRQVSALVGRENVFSVGVRSASSDEIEYAASPEANFRPGSLRHLEDVAQEVRKRPVYLTIDMDVVDPAYAPGTGAPEPGGPAASELLEALLSLEGSNIVAADVMEVAPPYDPSGITALLAAKVVRQLIMLMAPGE